MMADQKPSSKKAAVKKSTGIKKAPLKKAATKKSTVTKKAAIKKAPIKRTVQAKSTPASTIKEPTEKPGTKNSSAFNKEALATIQSIVNEMREENKNRDIQITSLVKEIRQGFSAHSDLSSDQKSERDEEMARLYQSLQSTFNSVKSNSNEQEDRSLLILKSLTNSIMQDHEQTLKEVHEQEILQDKKFAHLTKVEEHRAGRNKWIAIPGMIMGIIAIVYMFNVVNVMETAMTSMSQDMAKMQIAVGAMTQEVSGMSKDTHSMNSSMVQLNSNVGKMSKDTHSMNSNMTQLSKDTTSMNGSMTQLTNNVGIMSQDLNIMTRNVAPTMKGMRDMMPWSP